MNRSDRTKRGIWQLLATEAASGAFLVIASAAALLAANSPWAESYERLWGVAPFESGISLHFVINEGLMTIFFLVVGLEIRREIHGGALSSLRTATLPLVAASGGVIAPALIYLAMNADPALQRGWAVPTATDIAFAVGVLALLGKRIPPALRVLLLALAIADDISAVLIIALFYANGIAVAGLALAVFAAASTALLHKYAVRNILPYVICAAALWYGLLTAGLHPALAGVIFGLLTPMPASNAVANALHPWVAFGVMPLFALANAGVNLSGFDVANATSLTVATAIVLGLAVGKPLGITAAVALAVRSGLCAFPSGVTWGGVVLVGCLGGIGFTMSIFIATLAFPDPRLLVAAKIGVLLASVLAGTVGLLVGRFLFSTVATGSPGR